ncbi:MAG: hypothetical protein A49_32690 [Methyloceanibacter sp.]|nr:MAG: hypothetical protein A49_32690 [Methyloceanibacter sp.]
MQETLGADPATVLDQLAMHERDLTRRPSEGATPIFAQTGSAARSGGACRSGFPGAVSFAVSVGVSMTLLNNDSPTQWLP